MSAAGTIRIDKWLWHARFFKTRTLAARIVSGGKVRVNGTPVSKPARTVGPGDTLTFAQGDDIRVIRILAPGARRGPAPEAQALYEDLDPPQPRSRESAAISILCVAAILNDPAHPASKSRTGYEGNCP